MKFIGHAVVVLLLAAQSAAAGMWQNRIAMDARLIRDAKYETASTYIDEVIGDMVERLGSGSDGNQLFATALVHKALASAGLGNVNEALWYWSIAQQIAPDVAKSDLSSFGAPGEFLARHPMADPPVGPMTSPPKVVKKVVPKFPPGASRFGIAGDLVVQVVVDRNGEPTLPKIVRALPAPTLSFVALEALRQWRFAAATNNGEPVPAVFDLTVHYKL